MFQKFRGTIESLFVALLFVTLFGCETPKQKETATTPHGYTELDQTNSKDEEFFQALKKNLKNLGSLMTVSADTKELNLYREGKRSYPTNYRYTIKPNPTSQVSLEDIKQANLS
jgi:hypothetical protein